MECSIIVAGWIMHIRAIPFFRIFPIIMPYKDSVTIRSGYLHYTTHIV